MVGGSRLVAYPESAKTFTRSAIAARVSVRETRTSMSASVLCSITRMRSQYSPAETRRNYILLVAEGILFTVGLVFFDPNTVLPLLMERLTGSIFLVGLLGAVQPLTKGFVPVLAGNWIASMPFKKRFLVRVISIGRLPLWILGAALILLPRIVGDSQTVLWAGLLLLVHVLFWFGDSAGDPAWMDLVGKSVAVTRRGRFFASRQVVGGVLSIAAGAGVAGLLDLEALAFPLNYGLVVCIGALIYTANVGTFVAMVERPGRTTERLALGDLIRRLPHYLHSNHRFARTMGVLLLVNLARVSLPFFIVFGRRSFGLAEGSLALILPLQMAGRISGAALWGYIGDRFGHHRGIRGVAVAFALPSILALVMAVALPASFAPIAFPALFFVLGFALEGWPPFINYMLEIVSEDERPVYAGLLSVGFMPAALAPIAGGLLVQSLGYPVLFGIAAGLAIAGMVLSTGLPPARRSAPAR